MDPAFGITERRTRSNPHSQQDGFRLGVVCFISISSAMRGTPRTQLPSSWAYPLFDVCSACPDGSFGRLHRGRRHGCKLLISHHHLPVSGRAARYSA